MTRGLFLGSCDYKQFMQFHRIVGTAHEGRICDQYDLHDNDVGHLSLSPSLRMPSTSCVLGLEAHLWCSDVGSVLSRRTFTWHLLFTIYLQSDSLGGIAARGISCSQFPSELRLRAIERACTKKRKLNNEPRAVLCISVAKPWRGAHAHQCNSNRRSCCQQHLHCSRHPSTKGVPRPTLRALRWAAQQSSIYGDTPCRLQ